MAHSSVVNAGQKYASAKKNGIQGPELRGLRAAAMSQGQATAPANELQAAINARIARANEAHQAILRSRY